MREPAGWRSATVRELGDIQVGRQRSPSLAAGPHQVPYLRVANVFDGFIDYTDVLTMSFSKAERQVFGVRPGDILLNEGQSLELVGRSSIYDGPPDRYCIQNTLIRYRCGKDLVPSFAQAVFKRWMDTGKFAQIAKQTTSIAHLGAGRFAALSMTLPPLPEQRRIAEILDTLDEAIRKTEQVIAKLQQMKRGLLHDLLTRGIDDNGEIRDPERHPEQFHDALVGRIPRKWRLVTALEAAAREAGSTVIGPFGSNLKADDYRASGVPVVFVRDVREDSFEWNSHIYLAPQKAQSLAPHAVQPGDVVVTKMGLPPCIAAVYPSWMPQGIITADIIRLRPAQDVARSDWLATYLNCEVVRTQVRMITGGVTRPKVTLAAFRNLALAVPSLDEQDRILAVLQNIARRIGDESLQMRKLQTIKHGLMDDLLTGKVRVPLP